MRSRQKKPRIRTPQISASDVHDEDNVSLNDSPRHQPVAAASRRKRRKRNHVVRPISEQDNADDSGTAGIVPGVVGGAGDVDDDALKRQQEDDRIEALIAQNKWAFCCSVCACSPERQRRAEHIKYVVSGNGRFPHRPCCHGILDFSPPPTWASNYETAEHCASEAWEKMLLQDESTTDDDNQQDSKPAAVDGDHYYHCETVDVDVIHKQYGSAKGQQSTYNNMSEAEDPTSALYLNNHYKAISRAFLQCAEKYRQGKGNRSGGAVVLDLFAGVGTTLVALKRLSIALKKVIHCEQDKVANYAFEENHKNKILNPPSTSGEADNTQWFHYPCFEDIAETDEKYNAFMDTHAPIDLIVAGPPCQDFSGINATRQGLDGAKGSYMMKTALFIRRVQSDPRQGDTPLYYLLENVVLYNDKKLPLCEGEKERISQALQCPWGPIELDAASVSPCTRRRSFFTNIRLRSWTQDDLDCNPTSVLRDGFRLAANLDRYEPSLCAKVPTFMASKARINDERMRVYRKGKPYVWRVIDLSERVDLMGYPPGYMDCIRILYETLLHNAHGMVASKHWTETLDPRYHTFQGAFHGVSNPYDFVDVPAPANSDMPREVEMQLLPFLASQNEFLKAEDYGKRLVGNAISVPVLEFCLRELTTIFDTCTYDGYDYVYAWHKVDHDEALARDA